MSSGANRLIANENAVKGDNLGTLEGKLTGDANEHAANAEVPCSDE